MNQRILISTLLTEFFIFGSNSSMALIDPTKELVPLDLSKAGETASIKIQVSRFRDWMTHETPEGSHCRSFLRGKVQPLTGCGNTGRLY